MVACGFARQECYLGIANWSDSGMWGSVRPKNSILRSGAIIGDGDRKSWDPRAPMIWDNFSIFRTNCAILTSNIRADPHMSWALAWMLSRCLIKWWEWRDSLADFSQRWQGIRQGIRTRVLICSFMLWANGKGEFFRVESQTSISRCEWIIFAREGTIRSDFGSDFRYPLKWQKCKYFDMRG